MSNEEMWDKLFERIDSLFKMTDAFEAVLEPAGRTVDAAYDALLLAQVNLVITFSLQAARNPSGVRGWKDKTMKWFREFGMTHARAEAIDRMLTNICDSAEEPLR